MTTVVSSAVDGLDWAGLRAEVNAFGCAQTAQLLTSAECTSISELYDEVALFRSTIDMARYRFGSGQYRYFDRPLPQLGGRLREAFYPHLLPIARDWAGKLGKPAPWRDTLADWLDMCHRGARPGRRRSCCATARETGMPCIGTCTATTSSRCRW